MNREEFLARRASGLGGSDMGAVLGLSKYKSPVDVWLSKVGRAPEISNMLPLKVGSYMEAFVCAEYSERTGRRTVRHNALLSSKRFPYLIGNVDRLVIPEGQKVAAVKGVIRTERGMEAKTASAFGAKDWGDAGSDEVLPEYRVQCETYLMLTGCQLWDLAVLIGNHDFRVYEMRADPELQEMIREAAVEFWEKYVVTQTPPPASCERDVARLFPNSTEGKVLQADEAMRQLVVNLQVAKSIAEQADEDVEKIEVKIKEVMGDAEALKDGATTLVTWKSSAPRVTIDSKLLKQNHPDIFQIVSKTGEPSRRFSIK